MPRCLAGHESAAGDYCDVCGRQMGGAPDPASPGAGPAGSGLEGGAPTGNGPEGGTATISGPESGAPTGDGPEGGASTGSGQAAGRPANSAPEDRRHTTGPAVPPPASPSGPPGPDGPAWSAVVTADRDYFERVVATGGPEAAAITFPLHCPERRFSLGTSQTGEQRQIGRHSMFRGTDPDINLTGPPADPGVSRLHAVLIGQADGGWAVLDPGSENGTLVNDQEIATGVQVPLHDGDRIHLGAWTAITIRRG